MHFPGTRRSNGFPQGVRRCQYNGISDVILGLFVKETWGVVHRGRFEGAERLSTPQIRQTRSETVLLPNCQLVESPPTPTPVGLCANAEPSSGTRSRLDQFGHSCTRRAWGIMSDECWARWFKWCLVVVLSGDGAPVAPLSVTFKL